MVWNEMASSPVQAVDREKKSSIETETAQGKTALQSGTDTLPYLMTLVAFFVVAGVGTTAVGYYVPFTLAGSAILSVGSGLLSTLNVSTPLAGWVGYQILAGAGLALGFDAPQLAAQTVFDADHDMTIALTIVTSLMNLGGALGVSIGTLILNSRVASLLAHGVPGLSSAEIHNSGLKNLLNIVPDEDRPGVAAAYAKDMQDIFHSTTAFAVLTFIIAWFMEWRTVKPDSSDEGKGNLTKVLNEEREPK